MKIEAGKFYKRRDGNVVTPEWDDYSDQWEVNGVLYRDNGVAIDLYTGLDLVEEATLAIGHSPDMRLSKVMGESSDKDALIDQLRKDIERNGKLDGRVIEGKDARICKLEGLVAANQTVIDILRHQLAAERSNLAEAKHVISDLSLLLDTYTKPRLIKTCWNNLFIDNNDDGSIEIDVEGLYSSKDTANFAYSVINTNNVRIGYLRHEHWQKPDSTVEIISKAVALDEV